MVELWLHLNKPVESQIGWAEVIGINRKSLTRIQSQRSWNPSVLDTVRVT